MYISFLLCVYLLTLILGADVDTGSGYHSSKSAAALLWWAPCCVVVRSQLSATIAVPDSYIGALSSSMFAGMMFGAIGWGTCKLPSPLLVYTKCLNDGRDVQAQTSWVEAQLSMLPSS